MLNDRKLPLVSVIIPIYKTERYLEECIASVLEQDYRNIEVILVDDGSPDCCPAICNDYSGKYENIRVIHQENQGAGAARNRGMEIACGEYLMFVDSDDCLDGKCAVRKLVEKAEEEQADIVTGNFRRFDVSGISEINRHHLKNGSYARTVDFRFKGFLTENHLISDCGKLYRASFLRKNHLKHTEYRVMEDKLHNMMCCTYEPVYSFIHESVYLYRVTEGSATDRYKYNVEDMAKAWLYVAESFWYFLEERGIQDDYKDLLVFHLFCGIFSIGRQSLLQPGRKRGLRIKTTAELLKSYGRHPLVRRMLPYLAGGKYVNEIRAVVWRILVHAASALFCLRAYRVLAWGIVILSGLGTEKRTSRLKYKRTMHKGCEDET